VLLYAGDIVIMSETAEGLKHIFCLNIICDRCKLTVNATKTKVYDFQERRKGK